LGLFRVGGLKFKAVYSKVVHGLERVGLGSMFFQECCEAALSKVGAVHGTMQFRGTVRCDGAVRWCGGTVCGAVCGAVRGTVCGAVWF
jgi:hypothetical protein